MFFILSSQNELFKRMMEIVLSPNKRRNERIQKVSMLGTDLVTWCDVHGLSGEPFSLFLAYNAVNDINHWARICEMRTEMPEGTIVNFAMDDLWIFVKALQEIVELARSDRIFWSMADGGCVKPTGIFKMSRNPGIVEAVQDLAKTFLEAESANDAFVALTNIYQRYGSGEFALYRAFFWDPEIGVDHIRNVDEVKLSSLLGYERQKRELLSNTEAFVAGAPANNVLLFGDSGTGKSTSIRALLNEEDLIRRGLRMIELKKDQIGDLECVYEDICERNYRFIIFMDDLSFEENETDYKKLKAVIDGSLFKRPENALIYATSNRRNIIREIWSERMADPDDVHGADTMQEKLSLSDRFGLTIWYGPSSKDEYIEMVRSFMREHGVVLADDVLERRALRWEIEHGGFNGRTAEQFVRYLMVDR